MDIIELIESDHRDVKQVFQSLRLGSGDREALKRELIRLLEAHTEAEERVVYPVIRDANPDGDEQVREGEEEHQLVDQMVGRLRELAAAGPDFEALVLELQAAVEHHVREEENEVLPEFREHSDTELRSRLARSFQAAKDGGVPDEATRTVVAGPATSDLTDLTELTKDELYEQAKQADIKGRSKMTKDELVDALQGET